MRSGQGPTSEAPASAWEDWSARTHRGVVTLGSRRPGWTWSRSDHSCHGLTMGRVGGGPQVLPVQAPAASPRFWQKGQDSCACKCSDLCGFLADWSLELQPTPQKLPRSGPERGGLNPVLMCRHLGSFPFLLCSVSHWPLREEQEPPEPSPGAKRPGSLAGQSGAWAEVGAWVPAAPDHRRAGML